MRFRFNWLVAGVMAFAINAHAAKNPSPIELKSQSVSYLEGLRQENVKQLQEVDKALKEKINSDNSSQVTKQIEALQADRHELMLRQDFLNRLIFQIDTSFSGANLKGFLSQALKKMATDDLLSGTKSDGLWKFLKFSAEALNQLPDRNDDVLAFLEGYMKHSVSEPITPEKYMSQRNYNNGIASESGSPATREEAGAFAAKRLHEMTMNSAAPVAADPLTSQKKTR